MQAIKTFAEAFNWDDLYRELWLSVVWFVAAILAYIIITIVMVIILRSRKIWQNWSKRAKVTFSVTWMALGIILCSILGFWVGCNIHYINQEREIEEQRNQLIREYERNGQDPWLFIPV